MKGLDATKAAETFAKAHPGKHFATCVSDLRDYAATAGRRLHHVMALVERAAATAPKPAP